MGIEVEITKKVNLKDLPIEERITLAKTTNSEEVQKELAKDEVTEVKVALLSSLNLPEDAIDILFADNDEKVKTALKEYFKNELQRDIYLYDLVNVYTFSKIVFDKPIKASEKYGEEQILALISFMAICNMYLGVNFDRSVQYFSEDNSMYSFSMQNDGTLYSSMLEESIKRFAMMYDLVASEVSTKLKTTFYMRTSKFENLMGLLLLYKPENLNINRWIINVATVTYLRVVNRYSDKNKIPEKYKKLCEAFDEAYDFLNNESFKNLID